MENRKRFSKVSVGLIFKYAQWNSSESTADPMEKSCPCGKYTNDCVVIGHTYIHAFIHTIL